MLSTSLFIPTNNHIWKLLKIDILNLAQPRDHVLLVLMVSQGSENWQGDHSIYAWKDTWKGNSLEKYEASSSQFTSPLTPSCIFSRIYGTRRPLCQPLVNFSLYFGWTKLKASDYKMSPISQNGLTNAITCGNKYCSQTSDATNPSMIPRPGSRFLCLVTNR